MPSRVLVTVLGPTAIGKTRLAIALASHYRTEIISADSRQFYKEMRIGTAVPSQEELRSIPHHLIQHRSIHEPYSVGMFETEAMSRLETLFLSHPLVVLVGGSGLYLNALLYGLDEFPEVDPGIRSKLNAKGIGQLQKQLRELDPHYFGEVDQQNPQRLIRALEVCIASGRPYSSFLNKKKRERSFQAVIIGLKTSREALYARINQRVNQMMGEGLLEEARTLYPYRNLNALQTVGYKELFSVLDGTLSLEDAVAEIKKNTRRYAKRQETWFRKQPQIHWFSPETPLPEIIRKIDTFKNPEGI